MVIFQITRSIIYKRKMKNHKQITINDVAKASGVSDGTVDRVLHNRGEVSEKTKSKILKVIKELGYRPNIYASLLSLKRQYTIIAIIPNFQSGEYWEQVYSGIQMGQNDDINQNIKIEIMYFNQFDYNSFETACSHTLSLNPNAVLIAPIYKECATNLAIELKKLKIPIICIDTKIDDSFYLAYYGIPQFESGYLAASLIMGDCHGKSCEVVNFSMNRGDVPENESTRNRYKGLVAYAKDYNVDCVIHECSIQPNNFLENMKILSYFFKIHPDVNKLIALNSRAYMVAEWLEVNNITDKFLIGFDALQKNLDCIRRGYMSIIIAERVEAHVHKAIISLIRYLVLNQEPENKNNYTSMDILNKHNVDFY